jgi:RNA polymerase sigma-70 factor (ECF subfamily)
MGEDAEGLHRMSDSHNVGEFTDFARTVEPKLRYALSGAYPREVVRDAVQDALIYAWEHWDRVAGAQNPAGYLYRVAQRRTWRYRWTRPLGRASATQAEPPWVEPDLAAALQHLSPMQRRAVFLLEGLGMSEREAAGLLGITRATLRTHFGRAMIRLRDELGVSQDV